MQAGRCRQLGISNPTLDISWMRNKTFEYSNNKEFNCLQQPPGSPDYSKLDSERGSHKGMKECNHTGQGKN